MTNEEIINLRQLILSVAPVATWTHAAIDALDALCEAARPPEIRIGQRYRTIQQKACWPPTEVLVVADKGHGTYLVQTVRDPGREPIEFRGCDLELLEAADAE